MKALRIMMCVVLVTMTIGEVVMVIVVYNTGDGNYDDSSGCCGYGGCYDSGDDYRDGNVNSSLLVMIVEGTGVMAGCSSNDGDGTHGYGDGDEGADWGTA